MRLASRSCIDFSTQQIEKLMQSGMRALISPAQAGWA
jgi:hypothetical protein